MKYKRSVPAKVFAGLFILLILLFVAIVFIRLSNSEHTSIGTVRILIPASQNFKAHMFEVTTDGVLESYIWSNYAPIDFEQAEKHIEDAKRRTKKLSQNQCEEINILINDAKKCDPDFRNVMLDGVYICALLDGNYYESPFFAGTLHDANEKLRDLTYRLIELSSLNTPLKDYVSSR